MQLRKTMAVLSALSVTAMAAPAVAGAATPHARPHAASPAATTVSSLSNVPVSGKARNGKAFSGHMNITHFVTKNGKTYADGTLTGRLGNRSVKATEVSIPAKVPAATASSMMRSHAATASAAAACPVLHLVLGPLNLNLLGLNVSLNQVVLDITAQSGPGNLLGNLVCSVANLLNNQSILGQELTGLLNVVNGILGSPGVLNL